MIPNPFVALWENPIVTLTAIAYGLLLLSITIALAGVMWKTVLHLANVWEHRHTAQKFGPQWQYVPPVSVFGWCALLTFLGFVETLLLTGIVFLLT